MPSSITVPTTLVPLARLGEMLRETREAKGLSLALVSSLSRNEFSGSDLQLIEFGLKDLSDQQVKDVSKLYGIIFPETKITRPTLILDRGAGRIVVGDNVKKFAGSADDRDIMMAYLSLVYRLRSQGRGRALTMRTDDLDVLAQVFSSSSDQVRFYLEDLMVNEAQTLSNSTALLRKRLIIPALGALVCATVGGVLIMTQRPAKAADLTSGITQAIPGNVSHINPQSDDQPSAIVATVGSHIERAVAIERSKAMHPSSGVNIGQALTIVK